MSENPIVPHEEVEEEITVEEEFRGLYDDVNKLEARWKKLALMKQEEGDKTFADIIRLVAGDLLPLFTEVIAATGQALSDMEEVAAEGTGANEGLDEEEAVIVYTTLYSNEQAFRQLAEGTLDSEAKVKLLGLAALNVSAMDILKDVYGDEIAEDSKAQIDEAQGDAEEA